MQLRYLVDRRSHRYNLILKARQFGFTTLHCIDLLDEALWVSGMTCAILAHEQKALEEIFQIVKRAYDNIPEQLKPKTKTDTVRMYRFTERFDGMPLDSSIYVSLKLRSGTVQKLHISEGAYVKDRQELKSGSKQAVPKNGWITEETTGNGFEDFYDTYTMFDEIEKPQEHDYKTYFYPWIINPEYALNGEIDEYTADELQTKEIAQKLYNIEVTDQQLLWRRWKIRDLKTKQEGVGLSGTQLFKQEYPLTKTEAFQSAAGQVYDATVIDGIVPKPPLDLKAIIPTIPEHEVDKIRLLKLIDLRQANIYVLPDPTHSYVIGGDPSDGTQGGDFSSLSVWDTDTLEQVAQYYGKLRPDYIAELAANLGYLYNEAYIGIENNMLSAVLFLKEIYRNYHTTIKVDKRTKERTKKLGWTTDSRSRDLMIDDHIILFEDGALTINSKISLSQMKTFVTTENGKREHAEGKNDDALISDMIALQMRKHNKPKARGLYTKPQGF